MGRTGREWEWEWERVGVCVWMQPCASASGSLHPAASYFGVGGSSSSASSVSRRRGDGVAFRPDPLPDDNRDERRGRFAELTTAAAIAASSSSPSNSASKSMSTSTSPLAHAGTVGDEPAAAGDAALSTEVFTSKGFALFAGFAAAFRFFKPWARRYDSSCSTASCCVRSTSAAAFVSCFASHTTTATAGDTEDTALCSQHRLI